MQCKEQLYQSAVGRPRVSGRTNGFSREYASERTKCRSYYPCIRDYAFPLENLHMLEKCIRGMQESEVVGGWPAVAVGYDLEGTIRFRTCPRFPARGDWFLMRRTSCLGVSESAHPSGDVDDGNRMASQMESGLQASTWRYDSRSCL